MSMNIRNISVLFVFMVLILTGCQSNKSAVGGYLDLDTDLKIEFFVDSDINPDDNGTPSPLFLRLYELKSDKMIKKADFIDLYEQDKKTLGADMIGDVHKLKRFRPGEGRIEHFVLGKNTYYVALYAEFLDFKESGFKLVIPVVANNVFRNSANVLISGNRLSLMRNTQ